MAFANGSSLWWGRTGGGGAELMERFWAIGVYSAVIWKIHERGL